MSRSLLLSSLTDEQIGKERKGQGREGKEREENFRFNSPKKIGADGDIDFLGCTEGRGEMRDGIGEDLKWENEARVRSSK